MEQRDSSSQGDTATIRQLQHDNKRLQSLLLQHGIDPATGASTQPATAAPLPAQPTQQACPNPRPTAFLSSPHGLSKQQVERYSRQLLLPSFGLKAQEGLCKGSVLIVGCGGLGSPAALYLAAAGVGRIGLVDHDVVEISNMHRQVIHTEAHVGEHKALSAAAACAALNSLVQVQPHTEGLNAANALKLISGYDVVLDASDNPPTRYLISDTCVVAGKPLVSAAAVGTDGQLTVYNYGPDGPCYRCLFPASPAPENCSRCADAGVLGPVPGVMGVLQAVEVVKILGVVGDVLARKLIIYDALAGRFTSVKLRGRRPECVACGTQPLITNATLPTYDYVAFTGQEAADSPLPPISLIPDSERLTVHMFKEVLKSCTEGSAQGKSSVPILDVRPATQVELYNFPGAVHIPFERLESRMDEVKQLLPVAEENGIALHQACHDGSGSQCDMMHGGARMVVLCRRGNNSQRVVARLKELGVRGVTDVIGGVDEWVRVIDQDLPRL